MARILLINPNRWGRGITPIWIAANTAALKASGHDVRLFDASFYRSWSYDELGFNTHNNQYLASDYPERITFSDESVYDALQARIDDFRPEMILLSALSSHMHGEGEYNNIEHAHTLVSRVATEAVKVAGGLQPTARPLSMFARFPAVDLFVRGDSEPPACEIAARIDEGRRDFSGLADVVCRVGDRVYVGAPRPRIHDLDTIPPYDYSVFDDQVFLRPYRGEVVRAVDYELSRGCIFTCTYCVETVVQDYYAARSAVTTSGALRHPRSFLRAKSAKRIFDEIVALHRDYGINLLRCQDTNFLTINRAVLRELAQLMRNGPPVRLYVETRLDRITPSDIELLLDLQVDGIGSGVETAGEDFLSGHLNRFQSEERLLQNARALREAGIRLTTYNIIGLPNQTEEMILDTIRLNSALSPDSITVAFYSPYAGTHTAEEAEQHGYFAANEANVDGQLRTKTHDQILNRNILEFYKENFVHLATSPEVSDMTPIFHPEPTGILG